MYGVMCGWRRSSSTAAASPMRSTRSPTRSAPARPAAATAALSGSIARTIGTIRLHAMEQRGQIDFQCAADPRQGPGGSAGLAALDLGKLGGGDVGPCGDIVLR